MRHVVIAGASLAGVHTAESLRERGYAGDITLLSAEPELPYDRPPLSKDVLLRGTLDAAQLRLRPDGWYAEHGIDLALSSPAIGIDVASRTIATPGGRTRAFDGLVIATGSRARTIPAAQGGSSVHTIRAIADVAPILTAFRAGTRLVVIGGGFVGLEVASSALRHGMDVTVVMAGPAPFSGIFGPSAGMWYRTLHERHGVRMVCGRTLAHVEERSSGPRVHLDDGSHLDGDLVVAGVGAEPALGWLTGSGIGVSDGVLCNPTLAASMPGVVAAGDVARWRNPLFAEEMRVEHWTNAIEQGRHAAGTLLGERDPYRSVPYFWTDQFGARLRFVGRSAGADSVHVERADDDALVVLYGRAGRLTGALCVNTPKEMARHRRSILEGVTWEEATGCTAAAKS